MTYVSKQAVNVFSLDSCHVCVRYRSMQILRGAGFGLHAIISVLSGFDPAQVSQVIPNGLLDDSKHENAFAGAWGLERQS